MENGPFLQYLTHEKRYSGHTVKAYETDLSEFQEFISREFDVQEPPGITHLMVRQWVVSLMDAGLDPRSVNRKISSLKTWFRFLMRSGAVTANPMLKISGPKTAKKLPVFVEETRMGVLLDDIVFPPGFDGTRDRIILELFYATGMRLSELLGLSLQSVNFFDKTIRVLGKRNKERLIPFSPRLEQSLLTYLEERNRLFGASGPLVVSDKGKGLYAKAVYRIVNSYLGKVTTLDKKSPHVLRHTFATHMLNHGSDLNAIKEILGHASLSATQVYTHNTIEKLKKAYGKAHPRGDD